MALKLEHIHRVALDLFKEKGIESTSIYNIALVSKTPYSILDEKYPTKKDFIYELYSIGIDDMFRFIYGEILNIDDFKTMMRTIFHQTVEWGIQNSDLFHFIDTVSKPFQWQAEDNNVYLKTNLALRERYQKEIEKGVVKNLPPDFISHYTTKMLSACISYIISLKTIKKEEYTNLLNPMFESCWDALKK